MVYEPSGHLESKICRASLRAIVVAHKTQRTGDAVALLKTALGYRSSAIATTGP
jgi:hypothetical protein